MVRGMVQVSVDQRKVRRGGTRMAVTGGGGAEEQ